MVIRHGYIQSAQIPVFHPSMINQPVYIERYDYVGKIENYDHTKKVAYVAFINSHLSPLEVQFNHLRQIFIVSKDRVNDLQPDNDGATRRLLRPDQWEYALENYVMTGKDQVQFGWWKENESDPYTYFQLALTPAFAEGKTELLDIARLARKRNMFGDYQFETPEAVVEAYLQLKSKKKK
jgi:hypothetical protein